ncbi:MAG: hypothetical protein ACOX9C_12565 [Kiritimatiellia bacterium]|jgi:hypothetical protein
MKSRRFSPKAWLALFALLCALWCLWHPRRMDALFGAIPSEAIAVSYHVGLAAEWKTLGRNETFLEMLGRAGVSDIRDIVAEPGVYQTIFWLTGRNTVVGYIPHAWGTGAFDDAHLAGASHVGWKTKFMELLWRVKWIPGLGRMETTPSGTRFMRFDGLVDSCGRDLLLGLDIVDGMLLATLSTDPETVRQLATRVMVGVRDEHLAAAFADVRPWEVDFKGVRHAVWTSVPSGVAAMPATFTTGSFKEPGVAFTLRAKLDDPAIAAMHRFSNFNDLPAPGMGIRAEGVPLLAVFDAAAVAELGALAPPVGEGLAAAYLSGKPYEGRIMGLACPAINAVLPWSQGDNFKAWSDAWIETARREAADAKLKTDFVGREHVQTRFVFSSHLDFLSRARHDDMAFLELEDDCFLHIGSHYGSYRRRCASGGQTDSTTLDAVADTWRSAHPAAVAAARADMPTMQAELRHLGAIAKLAGSLTGGGEGAAVVEGVAIAEYMLDVMTPLGVVDCVAFAEPDGWVRLDVRAEK